MQFPIAIIQNRPDNLLKSCVGRLLQTANWRHHTPAVRTSIKRRWCGFLCSKSHSVSCASDLIHAKALPISFKIEYFFFPLGEVKRQFNWFIYTNSVRNLASVFFHHFGQWFVVNDILIICWVRFCAHLFHFDLASAFIYCLALTTNFNFEKCADPSVPIESECWKYFLCAFWWTSFYWRITTWRLCNTITCDVIRNFNRKASRICSTFKSRKMKKTNNIINIVRLKAFISFKVDGYVDSPPTI